VSSRLLALLAPLPLLAACGDLPRPFQGQPGATAMRLAQPPPPRLAIPAPTNALLTDAGSQALADAVADGLQAREVPAVAGPVRDGDWRLITTAGERGGAIVPVFTVEDPKGEDKGKAEGKPVTLAAWAAADPRTFKQVAIDSVPNIADLLTRIEAARQRSDPSSLMNRPAKVDVADVDGARGDGNRQLTKLMRDKLAAKGFLVQDTATGADFILAGHVRMVPIEGKQERVEIQWVLTGPKGDERGRVIQLNEIPAGTLDLYWGDVAVAVTTEASAGVHDALLTQTGRK
jgi:hypothetical protein